MTKAEYMECHDDWDDGEPIRVRLACWPWEDDEEVERDEYDD